jgi:hypothetical protein
MSPANRYGCALAALVSPLWAFGGLTAPAGVARVPACSTSTSPVSACNAWNAARAGDDVTEQEWELIFGATLANAPDFGAVLRSEAVTSLPPALALALSQVEYVGRGVESGSAVAETARTTVAPLWFDLVLAIDAWVPRRI